jgi:competence/damage-inducible protein CinA-like protein
MHAELIAIGSELVLGEIVDTNSAHIARGLRTIGLPVGRSTCIADDVPAIIALVREAAARSPVVITTGGLGPTVDDPTRGAIAAAFGRELEWREELWGQIQARFRRFGRTPGDNNRQQAYIPAGAEPIENPVGTAPCFIVDHGPGVVIALPGVPREMEHLLDMRVLPYLRERFDLRGVIKARVLRTIGVGESVIDAEIGELEKLTNPAVALNAHAGNVDIRITAMAGSNAEAEALIAPVEAQIRQALSDHLYGVDKQTIDDVVFGQLHARGLTLAVAESGTEGRLNARLAVHAQAGGAYLGAHRVGAEDLDAQAQELRTRLTASWALVARGTPGEQRRVELALAGPDGVQVFRSGYAGPPASLGLWASTQALNLLWRALKR